MRVLENAKRSVQPQTGPIGVFMRVTLAVIFMYLIVISYLMLGTTGLVFVSVLSLVAYFVPYLYQLLKPSAGKAQSAKREPYPGTGIPAGGLSSIPHIGVWRTLETESEQVS